jgi:hypothetical protein
VRRQQRLGWIGNLDVPLTFVYTADLAGYLAAAVDRMPSVGAWPLLAWRLTSPELRVKAGFSPDK